MKKTKTKSNRGITLIALVITIIVLLILAAVSIATLTGENGILTKANDAKTNNTIGEEKEQIGLAYNAVMADNKGSGVDREKFETELKKYDSEITVADEGENFKVTFPNGHVYTVNKNGTIDDSAVGGTTPPTTGPTMLKPGDKATKTETDNYEDANHDKATIPKDFTVSKEDNTIKDGLVVIGPDESEFVWVPVADITTMAKKTDGVDDNGNDNYEGKLYRFTAPSGGTGPSTSRENPNSSENTAYGQGTTSYREPSLVTLDDSVTKAFYGESETVAGSDYDAKSEYYDTILGYDSAQEFGKAMQEDYNSMVESVKTYGGFYVGRYEMSLTGADGENQGDGTAQSKGNVLSSTAVNSNTKMWYGLYSKAKTYPETLKSLGSVSNVNIVSGMIWGSQWDAMLNWMQGNGVDVTSTTPKGASYNQSQVTGSVSSDKINNVYDLLGCHYDWTLEANSTKYRVRRGGRYGTSNSPSDRSNSSPTDPGSYSGSRLALYIK